MKPRKTRAFVPSSTTLERSEAATPASARARANVSMRSGVKILAPKRSSHCLAKGMPGLCQTSSTSSVHEARPIRRAMGSPPPRTKAAAASPPPDSRGPLGAPTVTSLAATSTVRPAAAMSRPARRADSPARLEPPKSSAETDLGRFVAACSVAAFSFSVYGALVEANATVSTAAPSGSSRSASREASTAIEAESSS